MAGEWREVTLSAVAEISSGKRPQRVAKEPSGDLVIPVIGGGGPSGYTDTALFNGGVLITGRVGTLGKLFAPSGPCWPSDNALVLQPRGTETDSRFLRYALEDVIAEAAGMNRGAANPLITQGDLGRLKINHPPLPEQRAIAHILGTLDDKIELNRRMSETLEAMARALFKSWFVDFDPVRAKMEGHWRRGESLPGLPAHLYDLFPNRLVDSELGEIPEGWEVGSLGEYIVNFDSLRVPLSSRARETRQGVFPYYGAAGISDYVDGFLFDGIYVLVGEDGSVMTELGNAVTQYVWGKFWVNNHAHVLQGKDAVSTEQIYLYFKFETVVPFVTGAVQPKLSQGRMNLMPFIFAGESICKDFSRLISPWFAQIRALTDESRTLAALRDVLLPRLISGELRANSVDELMEVTA